MKKLAIAALATLLTTNAFAAQGDILARFRVTNVNPDRLPWTKPWKP